METITKKIAVFLEALQTLEDILPVFSEYKSLYARSSHRKNKRFCFNCA